MHIISSRLNEHVSIETVYELERELLKLSHWKVSKAFSSIVAKILLKIFKSDFLLKFIPSQKSFFVVLMHINAIQERCYPYFFLNAKKKVIYLFDAWEPLLPSIKKVIVDFEVDLVLISAKQSVDILNQKQNRTKFIWVPEGIIQNNYKYMDYELKDIEIIQLGRKYDLYHDLIINYCNDNQITYLYEKVRGDIIFKENDEFIDALSRSKISICFPSAITHPERSGCISTMTKRYLESMASKCLIVGSMPNDMNYLFDYNPIIEADLNNPELQLKEILKNYKSYIPLIEKNYLEVKNKHQWKNRVCEIQNIIDLEFNKI